LWDVGSGKASKRYHVGDNVGCGAFSPNGKTVAVAGSEITQWDVNTGQPLAASANPIIDVYLLRFSRDSRRLIGRAWEFIGWDTTTGREVRRYPESGRLAA